MPTPRTEHYPEVLGRIDALLQDEDDWIAAMATVTSELYHSLDHYHWVGFYRAVKDDELVIGPHQGGHGCLRIPFAQGVCGAAARTRTTLLVPDVDAFEGHIACSPSTRSEIVVPVLSPPGHLLAVLDVDSNNRAAFDETDRRHLEMLCTRLGEQFAETNVL